MSETAKKPTVKKSAEKKTTTTKTPAKTIVKTMPGAKKLVAETVPAAKPATRKAAPKQKTAAATGPQLVPALTHEQIARRAYEIWAGRGYRHGDPVHDWWQAEQELKRA